MGKPVSSNVERVETTGLNTKVNKKVFEGFKDCCKYLGYPMNVMLETFMQQYANGRFELSSEDILKWKGDKSETDILNSSFNKKIYLEFKSACKSERYFVRHVITAFMEKVATGNLILEYVNADEVKKNK